MVDCCPARSLLGFSSSPYRCRASRRRELTLHLHALTEAMDEQSRLMERMRRSLTDIMEVLVSLESEAALPGSE